MTTKTNPQPVQDEPATTEKRSHSRPFPSRRTLYVLVILIVGTFAAGFADERMFWIAGVLACVYSLGVGLRMVTRGGEGTR